MSMKHLTIFNERQYEEKQKQDKGAIWKMNQG